MAKKKETEQLLDTISQPEDSSIPQTDSKTAASSPGAGVAVHPDEGLPKTDPNAADSAAAQAQDLGSEAADTAVPQTEKKAVDDITSAVSAAADTAQEHQTGKKSPEFPEAADSELISEPRDDAVPQTEPEMGDDMSGSTGTGRKKASNTKTDKKTAANAVSSAKATAGGQIRTKKNAFPDESDAGEPAATNCRQGEAEASGRPAPSQQPKPARRSARRTAQPIVAIDDVRSVETDEDKMRNDLLDLVESMKGKKVLSGTIQGVERSEENPDLSFAVLYHGDFKVIIPAEEAVECPSDLRDRTPGDVMHYLLTKRLGAEVDYIVKGADQQTGIAAASRLEAMARKRKAYYFGTDRDGNNLLYEGISAEARIVSVIRAGIFVDLFGVEVYIPLRELSYQRWLDAGAHFQPGQRVLVKILGINREDRNNIRVAASVKQAGENPYEKALRRYTVGSRYVGTVSMVDTNGVFVSLDGGIDCLCSYPKRGRPPRGARVTVRILGINRDSNRIWGAITHMTTPR